MDDHSGEPWQGQQTELEKELPIRLFQLPENVGRSAIRNRLAEKATQPFLLFLDNDSGLIRPDFISVYLGAIEAGGKVICGGRLYGPRPEDPRYQLHWHYGVTRESQASSQRSLDPHRSFMTNNFVVSRELILAQPFDERLNQYGHEDTVFGYQLKKLTVDVLHIDNPVKHLDLEENQQFVHKTELGLQNLKKIQREFGLGPGFTQSVSLLAGHERLRPFHPLIRLIWGLGKDWMRRRLCNGKASLALFQFYKLAYFDAIRGE